MIRIGVVGARLTALGFEHAAATVRKGEIQQVRKYGQLLLTRVKAHASGRPGPNAPTGDYRRSWSVEPSEGVKILPIGAAVTVGTNAPQGRRLEYGFVGTDSLGRHYDQPPYPHVGPACDETEPEFAAAMEGLVRRL